MFKALIAVLALTTATTPTFANPEQTALSIRADLNRVDPSKVLDLINRIKKSGGSLELLAQ